MVPSELIFVGAAIIAPNTHFLVFSRPQNKNVATYHKMLIGSWSLTSF